MKICFFFVSLESFHLFLISINTRGIKIYFSFQYCMILKIWYKKNHYASTFFNHVIFWISKNNTISRNKLQKSEHVHENFPDKAYVSQTFSRAFPTHAHRHRTKSNNKHTSDTNLVIENIENSPLPTTEPGQSWKMHSPEHPSRPGRPRKKRRSGPGSRCTALWSAPETMREFDQGKCVKNRLVVEN